MHRLRKNISNLLGLFFIALLLLSAISITTSAQAITREARLDTRYIAQGINEWREGNRQDSLIYEARLSHLAEELAKRIARYGTVGYSESWIKKALTNVSFNASSLRLRVIENHRSKESVVRDLTGTRKGRDFLSAQDTTHMGVAYLGTDHRFKNPRTQNLRVIIFASETKKVADGWARGLLKHVNAFRAEYALPPLTMNRILSRAAQAHADDMGINDYFAHINRQGKGPGYRAKREGYDYELILENLAAGQDNPKAVVEAWKKSKDGHREAMLDTEIVEAGFGYRFIYNDQGRSDQYHYWAMSMGKPR